MTVAILTDSDYLICASMCVMNIPCIIWTVRVNTTLHFEVSITFVLTLARSIIIELPVYINSANAGTWLTLPSASRALLAIKLSIPQPHCLARITRDHTWSSEDHSHFSEQPTQ